MSSMRNQAARAGMTRFAPVKAELGLSMSLYRPGRHRRGREKPRRGPLKTIMAAAGGEVSQ